MRSFIQIYGTLFLLVVSPIITILLMLLVIAHG